MSTLRVPDAPAPVVEGHEHNRRYTRSFLALMGGAVAIGFAPIFVRLSETGPVATAAWRVLLALPVLWVVAALVPEERPASVPVGGERISGGWMMVIAGLFFAADLAVWHWSIRFTSVANSTLLANFAPVIVVLHGRFVYGHRSSRRFLLAMLVALAGMILLVGRDFRLDPRALFGDVLGLVTAVFYAGYLLSIKELRGRYPTMKIMARTALFTALALLPVVAVSGEAFLPHTTRAWLVLVGLALVSHVGGQTLIAFALARLPASVASVSLLVQPVTASLAAAALLGESVAALQALGMALVLAGVFVARQEGQK